ncbi:MAG: ADP-ribosylation factor-like protein [Candidatus Thorarchaeota archaeon]|jgi:small GTP-binding protein
MIHNVLLINNSDGKIIVRARFWKVEFEQEDIMEFLRGHADLFTTEGLAKDTPVFVGADHKVFHSPVGEDILLIFVTDGRDEDRTIQHKVREGGARISTALRGNSIGYIKDNLEDILGELIFTRFKISFVGSGGVGKSTLMRLLFGKDPAPGGYVPTINVAVDSSETIQFGTFLVTIWDFAGQAVFQDLWSFYFQGTDVIFLITDSSFRNVMQTKTLLRNIRKEAPSSPLFIVANKQDLPESMKADKIKRLLGAPTFPMVGTDKARREEFIRFMLEVAAKTVGVTLPERPISEMITVRRRTEDIDRPELKESGKPGKDSGFEDVPYKDGVIPDSVSDFDEQTALTKALEDDPGKQPTSSVATGEPPPTSTPTFQPTKVIAMLLILQQEGLYDVAYHLDYTEEVTDTTAVASLISALDSFGGIDSSSDGTPDTVDALETIEHEGNLVMVEKSTKFVMALIVNNDGDEANLRTKMSSLLFEIEEKYSDIWDVWDGDKTVFETSIYNVLGELPLRPISLDYAIRAREAGKGLPFANRDVGSALVAVKTAIDGTSTVGGLVRAIDLPREQVIGSLQIMQRYGWIDYQVTLGPNSHLRKIGDVDEDTQKAYGEAVVKFVGFCDGMTPLEDVVKKVGVSLPAMKFVATKLVLDGVLEVVA